jgi:N-acetylneuraminate synthase
MEINGRAIGKNFEPLVIAEIGINHGGSFKKAQKMIKDAYNAGAECVKFQSHIIEDEMTIEAKSIIPENANESIYDIMKRCSLTYKEEKKLKEFTESFGMIYLSTPFSRAAADRLEDMNVKAFKIGSGECNNYPLLNHIASFGKPIILSTGMNNINNIKKSVAILEDNKIDFALLHCTSLYPTPYDKVRLGALKDLSIEFPNVNIGLSDHSIGNYTCFAAIALGATILEKHFTSSKKIKGPDIPISINPRELKDLIKGSKAIHKALGGNKEILKEELKTANFAYASVVSISNIEKGEKFSKDNIWVKRPGNGEIKAEDLTVIIGKKAAKKISAGTQLKWSQVK